MRFEVVNALRSLDERTPAFFMSELFTHGELKLKIDALEVLRDLDPEDGTSAQLRAMIELA